MAEIFDEAADYVEVVRRPRTAPWPTGWPRDRPTSCSDWGHAGLAGVRLRPGALPHDLHRITRELVPELQRRGAFRNGYSAYTLRGHFGLARPANRYAA